MDFPLCAHAGHAKIYMEIAAFARVSFLFVIILLRCDVRGFFLCRPLKKSKKR